MRHYDDEDGTQAEIRELIVEVKNDVEPLNIAADQLEVPDDIKHMIASLADKISGISSLMH